MGVQEFEEEGHSVPDTPCISSQDLQFPCLIMAIRSSSGPDFSFWTFPGVLHVIEKVLLIDPGMEQSLSSLKEDIH